MRRTLPLLLLLGAPVLAQQEPTPFWMPPPPKKEEEKPAKKKKKPVQVEPLRMKQKEKPPPIVEKKRPPAPPRRAPDSPQPTWIEPPPREPRVVAPPPRERRLPVEPQPAPDGERAPARVIESQPPPVEPPPAAPARRAPAVVVPANPPASTPEPPFVPAEPGPALIIAEPESEFAPRDLRRFSASAIFGAWARSRSDGGGREWDMAYGLRLGFAIFPSLEVELQLARAGGASGSPFVSATVAHNLAALRAFWVLGDKLALLLGGGGGVALAQTHYSLLPSTDPGVIASGLDATALKTVIQITAAGRARVFGGLEARAEVSVLARDGRLELLPLLGIGWSF